LEDQDYKYFIINVLRKLEPRIEMEKSVLYEELDEINEIIFVQSGVMDIGFEINRIKKFVFRYNSNFVIGAYNCTFNQRSLFIYKCKTQC
jgi:hypothetical protein